MKLHDFGLWFEQYGEWSTTIPQAGIFFILYDGWYLGYQLESTHLKIWGDAPYKIQIKNSFPMVWVNEGRGHFDIGDRLTLNDFEIIENPDYVPDG